MSIIYNLQIKIIIPGLWREIFRPTRNYTFRVALTFSSNSIFSLPNKLSSEEFPDKIQLYEGLRSLWLSSMLSRFFVVCLLPRIVLWPRLRLRVLRSNRFFSRTFFFFIFDFIFVFWSHLKVTILCAPRSSFFLHVTLNTITS